jgi:hypothetical protein
MSKDYKGYELIKEITEGNIKEDTEIEVHSLKVLDIVVAYIKYKNKRLNWEEGKFNTSYLVDTDYYFRIVEEQEEIDIQSLHELALMKEMYEYDNRDIEINRIKINELVQAVKQIDLKIKEKQ